MMIFSTLLCLLNIRLNKEPNSAQATVEEKPTNAIKNEKNNSVGISLKCGNMNDDMAVIPYIISLGFISCNAAPTKKVPLLITVSFFFAGINDLTIR